MGVVWVCRCSQADVSLDTPLPCPTARLSQLRRRALMSTFFVFGCVEGVLGCLLAACVQCYTLHDVALREGVGACTMSARACGQTAH
jgi:hypothetical protein